MTALNKRGSSCYWYVWNLYNAMYIYHGMYRIYIMPCIIVCIIAYKQQGHSCKAHHISKRKIHILPATRSLNNACNPEDVKQMKNIHTARYLIRVIQPTLR
jgi:hypothetical protein